MNGYSLTANASQMLGLLAVVGVLAGAYRWRSAVRRDFLFSFMVFLAGTALRELPVLLGGVSGWSPELVALSGAARVLQIAGAVLFVRVALREACGEWGWISVLFVACVFATAV